MRQERESGQVRSCKQDSGSSWLRVGERDTKSQNWLLIAMAVFMKKLVLWKLAKLSNPSLNSQTQWRDFHSNLSVYFPDEEMDSQEYRLTLFSSSRGDKPSGHKEEELSPASVWLPGLWPHLPLHQASRG